MAEDEERTADSIIDDLGDISNLKTRDDVEYVLSEIGSPGDHRDLKDEVVGRIFTGKSPQGYSTVDDLTSYTNY